jgi:hypothetical protein
MLTNTTIELIDKALRMAINNSQSNKTKENYKNALMEFKEYICDLEDIRDNWED